jgi:hypothetical protein
MIIIIGAVFGALGGAFVGVQLSQECAEFCEGNYLYAQPFEVAVASAIGPVVGLVVGYMLHRLARFSSLG